MDISQLNLRGRMAYGIDCLILYLDGCVIDYELYADEIDILLQFTSAINLADWDVKAKQIIFGRFPDDVLGNAIPSLFEQLYRIGAGELYGYPTNCKESEDILIRIIELLHKNTIAPPSISAYSSHVLGNPVTLDDYFGAPFVGWPFKPYN